MRRALMAGLLFFIALFCAHAQALPGEVRVSVVLNADGSRTTYETDAGNRKSVATTTGANGKMREKINYDLDEDGRFVRGEVLGPKGEFRFNALYKYDANNHLSEETHLAKDGTVIGKIVFRYDDAGHQTGYAAYDGEGRLLGQTAASTATPAKRK
jgi:YD repeat-containing protein